MAQIETLCILEEIETLVSDKLQVVSYKWLSRNFLVSSNVAKRLLQEFVQKHTSGLEVVYTLSGWLKNNPPSYHIMLVSGPKLEEAKQEFDGNCSLHVYSVQAAIPKDPAALWNVEFVQAEELFKQPSAFDNCLRDNRFCGILNPFVRRNVDGTPRNNAALQPKSVGILGPTKTNSAEKIVVPPPQQVKVDQSGPRFGQQSTMLVKDIKKESPGTGVHYEASKPPLDKEKIPPPLANNEKKSQSNKSSMGNGGSLASLWGRASAKSKLTSPPAGDNSLISDPTASAEAQICACEAIEDGSSDDEAQNVNFRRASNVEGGRKRRVVLDYSDDEDEDAVSLASPDLPKGTFSKTPHPVKLNDNDQTESKLKVKEGRSTDPTSDQVAREKSSSAHKSMKSKDSSKENILNHSNGGHVKTDVKADIANAAPDSPKRRKVLKTSIDERGREVTEVVWEGEETETKKADSSVMKKAQNSVAKKAETNAVANTVNNRAAAVKKSAVGNTAPSNQGGKAGNKKGGSKDPKQGSLLSFFNKV